MDRRALFLAVAAAAAFPGAIRAQPSKDRVYRVGMLEVVPAERNARNLEAFRKGLAALGYVEGRNLVIEYRSADGDAARFPRLADDLVRRRVDVIVTRGTPAAGAAKHSTESIPVVMATMGDPRAMVSSFARPGGNVTGVTTFSTELTAKRIELLKELVPRLSRVALLHNMANPAAPPEWSEVERAARELGLRAELLDVRSDADLAQAFDAAKRHEVHALIVGADGLMQMNERTIVERVARSGLPATYPAREFVEAGGLMSYSVSYSDLYFRLASYVDKLLKGAKPAELPIEQPSRFELVVNVGTAKALGLAVPQSLLVRAELVP